MALLRRGAVAGIVVLIGFGFELSKIDEPLRGRLASGCWLLAAVWAFFALVTWQPIRGRIGPPLRNTVGAIGRRSPYTISINRRVLVALPPGQPGLLDFRRDSDRAMNAMVQTLKEMTEAMGRHTKRLNRRSARTRKAAEKGVTVEGAYRLVDRGARTIIRHAELMERLVTRFSKERAEMTQNHSAWLRGQPTGSDRTAAKASLRELGKSTKQGLVSMRQYRGTVKSLQNQNVNRALNSATDRLGAVLDRIISDFSATEAWCRKEGA